MKINNLEVGSKIKLSYAIVLFLLALLSIVSFWEIYNTHSYSEKLYNNPLQVRRAISKLEIATDNITLHMRIMLIVEEPEGMTYWRNEIIKRKVDIEQQFQILKERYMGSQEDILEIEKAYLLWEENIEKRIELIEQGDRAAAFKSMGEYVGPSPLKLQLSEKLEAVDSFAKNIADELYADSMGTLRTTYLQMGIIILLCLILVFVLSRYIYQLIKTPLFEMQRVMEDFSKGKYETRSRIIRPDEFGKISKALNEMFNTLELEMIINEKASVITNKLLSTELINQFFQVVLLSMIKHTGGELGAVYLRSTDQKIFEIATSIGMNDQGRASFNIEHLEGDLGRVVASGKIEKFTLNTEDVRFQHPLPYGELFPKEIITIPIVEKDEVILIVTLASISGFEPMALNLIENIYPILNTRMLGILSNNEIRQIRDELETKNEELKQQQAELQIQAAEIEQQKTELEKQNEELSEVSRLKTNFLSNMSHELRTPLNSIIALSGVLYRRLKNQISDEEYSYLEVIDKSGKSLLAMINDILDISRIESGRVEIENDYFNLNSLINELLEMLRPVAEQKGIEIVYNNADREIPLVSDEQKMRHILQNLMGNAIKFTDEGRVEVSAYESDGQVVIAVSDTGIGIVKEHLTHIFEEFRQADGSTTRKYGGTGLGLAISKRYTEMLGGRIEVESTLDKGSIFTVTIPLQQEATKLLKEVYKPDTSSYANQISTITETQSADIRDKGYKLLIVEDSEPAIIQLRDALSEEEYQITVTNDGAEALKKMEESIPDGIILDLMMPIKDGFQVLKEVRNSYKSAHVPVLVLTAKHIEKEELRTLALNNVHQLIQKGSLDRRELQDAVASMFLPAVKPTKPVHKEQMEIPEKPIVLVVEDNPDNRLTVKALLKDIFNIVEAEDGEAAVELAGIHMPDLILMDIALPGMDGVEAFRAIRKNPNLAHIPIIALTASAMTTDREIYLAHGFDAFIPKPIIEKQFMRIIEGVLYGK
ncbi:MAG: hybrid sensor histidine kinase/response regulator [Firmicutes bacterium HGW-Firmicutes-12]|nr:MAG: hybrid sensor histidine kinase/response regulator [Firmicutes bacterium HGW-Firmicutes-12]